MKIVASILSIFAGAVIAGESGLTTTYQPLDGLGAGEVSIVQVTCHQWFARSASSAIDFIHVRNVPPTDNPNEATADLNLASRCGLRFSTNDLGETNSVPLIVFDATHFDEAKLGGYDKVDIVRACLECLRLCLPTQLVATEVTLKCRESDREWLAEIVAEFNSAPRSKTFFEGR